MTNRPTGFASDALAGRTALVTGAAHGIGQAIAEAYAASGADLALVDLDSERLQAVAENCRGRGSSVVTVTADVSDEAQVTGMYHKAVESLGAIDTLVANAGILSEVEVAEMSTETFDRMIAVNLRSVFLCDRVVLPAMLEARFGRIINTASQIGQRGAPGFAHYAAAKAGIIGFTKSLAREVSKTGVTANCIAPGPISTGIGGGTLSPEWSRQLQAGLALGRFGVSDEVSPTAVLLASSPGGDLYTGATLGPNSGDVMFS